MSCGNETNFWPPKQHRRFRISDPPNNTGEDSEFLIPKQHRRFRISDPPNNTGKDSEFLIPQTTKERYRISNPLNKNTIQEGFQYFGTPKNIVVESEFLIPKQPERNFIFFSPVSKQWNASKSEVGVNTWFWSSARTDCSTIWT